MKDVVDIRENDKGNLVVTWIGNGQDRAEIRALMGAEGSDAALHALMEEHLCNGWTDITGEVGLTDAPAYSDEVACEYGEISRIGRAWYYRLYETKNPVEELLKRGYIILDRIPEGE